MAEVEQQSLQRERPAQSPEPDCLVPTASLLSVLGAFSLA